MEAKLLRVIRIGAAATMLFGAVSAIPAQTQPDNTKVNKRDRNKSENTADQAKNNKPDVEMMQQIRKSIMDDSSLSTYAHNVKVIGHNGKITLKGPVRSEEEKTSIVNKATEVAGAGNVINQLTVKPEKQKAAGK